MPTIRPGEVVRHFTTETDNPPPVFVGDPATAWSDDSDASYVYAHSTDRFAGFLAPSGATVFDLSGVGEVTSATLRVRASTTTDRPDLGYRFAIELRDAPVGSGDLLARLARVDVNPGDDAIHEHSIPVSAAMVSARDALVVVAIPVHLLAPGGTSGAEDVSVTVYEMWLDYIPATAPVQPPLRGWPRDDKLGNSTRAWPPPASRQGGRRGSGYL